MKLFFQAVLIFCVLFPTAYSNANVIKFDDLTVDSSINYGEIPAGYGGFIWGIEDGSPAVSLDFQITNQVWLQGPTYGNSWNVPSIENVAYNYYGGTPVIISALTPFTFNSAAFVSWGAENEYISTSARKIKIEGYLDSTFVKDITVNLTADEFKTIYANFIGINKLIITAFGENADETRWLMDDLTYNAPVPEPMTLTLFGIALIGLANLRRRMN